MMPPTFNEIIIIFKKEIRTLLSDKDMEIFKKDKLIGNSINLAKEELFKRIQNIDFEEFEQLIEVKKS